MAATPSLTPTSHERLITVDVLGSFALFGILYPKGVPLNVTPAAPRTIGPNRIYNF